MKKGQITVFLVIGIVILFLFLLLFYLSQQDEPAPDDTHKIIREAYRNYVHECAESSVNRGLYLVGMQGGAIYDFQAKGTKNFLGPGKGYGYGKHILPYEVEGIIHNVSYALTRPTLGSEFHPEPPMYPYGLADLVTNPKLISENYVNVFGNFPRNPFTPICDYHGENRRELSEAVACETYDSRHEEDHGSIQEYLARYIETETKKCLKLRDIQGFEYDTEVGNLSAKVTFGEDDVFVDLNVPVEIRVGDLVNIIHLEPFHIRAYVRLKKIHELVSHIIERDVNDIYFHMTRDASTLNNCKDITGGNIKCLRDGLSVVRKRNVCFSTGRCSDGNYDDILIVHDNKSVIDGRTYDFMVALENRRPAMNILGDGDVGSFRYDYIVPIGGKIQLEPKGIDPDEDQQNEDGFMDNIYHYYGWKQDYDERFFCPKGGCPVHDPSVLQKIENPVMAWTKSNPFMDTKRLAEYTVIDLDLGLHAVRVEVCDEEDLCDWQVVMILVTNASFVNSENNYPGMEGLASIEDPIVLHSPITGETLGINNPIYSWRIMDASKNVVWSGSTTDDYRNIPYAYTVEDIKDKVKVFFRGPGTYFFEVDILRSDGSIARPASDENKIEVLECLPHTSSIAPYPYNPEGTDDFLAEHACCNGGEFTNAGFGTIKGANSECFSVVDYGCREGFANLGAGESCSDSNVFCNVPTGSTYTDGIANDIYKRTFTRYCGERGNTCDGLMRDERERVKECGACQMCQYSSDGVPACLNYDTETVCNEDWKCTTGNGDVYSNNLGPYTCQAGCSSGDCDLSINCVCNIQCGATCEDSDDFLWDGYTCQAGCVDCMASGSETTICPAPEGTGCSVMDYEGEEYTVCPADLSGGSEITSGNYASMCKVSDFCYVAACSGLGASDEEADYCPDAGEVEDLEGTAFDKCFYGATGTSCNLDGTCDSSEDFGVVCAERGSDYCRTSNRCYYNVNCDAVSGWEMETATMYCASGTPLCTGSGVVCS